jgi:hypothetical protein
MQGTGMAAQEFEDEVDGSDILSSHQGLAACPQFGSLRHNDVPHTLRDEGCGVEKRDCSGVFSRINFPHRGFQKSLPLFILSKQRGRGCYLPSSD